VLCRKIVKIFQCTQIPDYILQYNLVWENFKRYTEVNFNLDILLWYYQEKVLYNQQSKHTYLVLYLYTQHISATWWWPLWSKHCIYTKCRTKQVCCDCWIYNTFLRLQAFVPLFMCAQVAGNWWHIILFSTTVNNSGLLFYYFILFSFLHFQNELKHFWNTMSFLSRGSGAFMCVCPKCSLIGKKSGITCNIKWTTCNILYFPREKRCPSYVLPCIARKNCYVRVHVS
jgi:hypothetical protein